MSIVFQKEIGCLSGFRIVNDGLVIGHIGVHRSDELYISSKFYSNLDLYLLKQISVFMRRLRHGVSFLDDFKLHSIYQKNRDVYCLYNKCYYLGDVYSEGPYYNSKYSFVNDYEIEAIIKFMLEINNITYSWKQVGF